MANRFVSKSINITDSSTIINCNKVHNSKEIYNSSRIEDSRLVIDSQWVRKSVLVFNSSGIYQTVAADSSQDVEQSLFVVSSRTIKNSGFIQNSSSIKNSLFVRNCHSMENQILVCDENEDIEMKILGQTYPEFVFREVFEETKALIEKLAIDLANKKETSISDMRGEIVFSSFKLEVGFWKELKSILPMWDPKAIYNITTSAAVLVVD